MAPVMRKGTNRLRNFLGHLVSNGYILEGFPFSKIVDVDHLADIDEAGGLIRSDEP